MPDGENTWRGSADRRLSGIIPAIVTPMSPSFEIDEDALVHLTGRMTGAGVGGIVPCGSTGEFSTLTHDERRRVTEVVIKAAGGRVPVIPHTGAMATQEAVELSRHAEASGAAAILVVAPYYEPLAWAELVAHFQAIRQAVTVPIIYYNLPAVTGIRLAPERLVELAQTCGIRYVKDTTGDAVSLSELVERYADVVTTFNGWDSITLMGLAAGTTGAIWGAASFMPEICVELFKSVHHQRDMAKARELWSRIWPICRFLETHTYVPAVKAAAELVGLSAGPPRPPFLPLPEDQRALLSALLQEAAVLRIAS